MRSRASSLIIVSSPFTREDTYLNTTIKRKMVHFWINKTHKYAKWLLISINPFLGSGRNFGYLFWGSGTLFKCQKHLYLAMHARLVVSCRVRSGENKSVHAKSKAPFSFRVEEILS